MGPPASVARSEFARTIGIARFADSVHGWPKKFQPASLCPYNYLSGSGADLTEGTLQTHRRLRALLPSYPLRV